MNFTSEGFFQIESEKYSNLAVLLNQFLKRKRKDFAFDFKNGELIVNKDDEVISFPTLLSLITFIEDNDLYQTKYDDADINRMKFFEQISNETIGEIDRGTSSEIVRERNKFFERGFNILDQEEEVIKEKIKARNITIPVDMVLAKLFATKGHLTAFLGIASKYDITIEALGGQEVVEGDIEKIVREYVQNGYSQKLQKMLGL